MIKQKNIIEFDPSRRVSSVENTSPMPQLVISAQRTAKHHLKELLLKFFSKIDDSLFNLAEKADGNQQQTLYFEAMREIRLQHGIIIKAYFSELETGFKLSLSQSAITSQSSNSLDQVGLMQDEQLEESLAITNMASTAENTCREMLSGLTARLNFLVEDIEITKDNNPLRPEVLCHAFSIATECMDTDIKIRLVIYKLFDKFVVQQLGPMYNTINADLIAAGVLPRIKNTIRKSEENTNIPVAGDATSNTEDSYSPNPYSGMDPETGSEIPSTQPNQSENIFASLQQMLSQQRAGHVAGTAMGSPTETADIANTNTTRTGADTGTAGMVAYAPQDIISALSKLQTGSALFQSQNKDLASAAIIKTTVMEEIARLQGNSDGKQIGQTDTDSIDIIGMLFDFILDDPGLPDSLKAQISRLQIPLLKVAILDSTFFSIKSHPARQLLNELAYAGNGLEEADPEEDKILQMVSHVVDRILSEFEENTGIFDSLLTEFTEFMIQERKSNKLAENMLEQARDVVANEIQRRVTSNRVPPLVTNILIDAWKNVLIHLYLRDGEEGTAWNTALQVADDLIWSVQPKLIVSERQRLIKIIPRILNGLRDGLTLIQFDVEATNHLFDSLEEMHLSSLRGGIPDTIQKEVTELPQQESTAIHYENTPNLTADDFGTDLSEFPEDTMEYAAGNNIEETVLTPTHTTSWEKNDFSQYAEIIKEMALGTWVEFTDPDTESRNRGKLAWKCDFTKEFTFIDRKYKVVADLSYHQLLEEFELGRASIIEDIPLFDRALDSVIVGIKKALHRKAPDGGHSNH